jgi:hypothetical protein
VRTTFVKLARGLVVANAEIEMENPSNLTRAELDALKELQEGASSLGADDPIWDGLEQLGLVESREKAHLRVLTEFGRAYPTG